MSELNGGLDALGTAMLVTCLGGVGAALLLTPPPQPAKAVAATSNTVINGYFIELYPFVLTVCRSHGSTVPGRAHRRVPVPRHSPYSSCGSRFPARTRRGRATGDQTTSACPHARGAR